jgi:hypothetical protein
MNKLILLIFAFCILSLTNVNGVHAASKVNVVVAGDINHGPMQPTINAIKEVTAKYGDRVNVTWIDLGTAEGAEYFKEHGLSAHLNVLINGHYQFLVDGRKVTFQWFEGVQWKKSDLDAVIAGLLNNSPNVTPLANTESGGSVFGIIIAELWFPIILAIAVIVGVFLYLVRKSRKRKALEKRTKLNGIGK